MSRRNSRQGSGRRNSGGSSVRTDRIGSTLREILADELARIDDDNLSYVTITEVDVDNELSRARVYLSSLNLHDDDIAALHRYSGRLKKAIGARARIRRVPELEFLIDPALVSGARISEILADMADDRAFAVSESGDGGLDDDTEA